MVKIDKKPEPIVLANNKNHWTTLLMGHIARGEVVPSSLSSNYNQTEVKSILKEESRGKCMYCESNVSHVAYEHIEHIKPKAKDKYPDLTFEWNNLGLACPKCNINKSDNYDDNLPFINPYSEDPELSLFSLGPWIYPMPGNDRGFITEQTIQLNRVDLIEKRLERINEIRRLIELYVRQKNDLLKNILKDEIIKEVQPNKPYSMCTKQLLSLLQI
ncbi:HNH endonuclease [Hymenobacter rubripertinctus]|uniref:HNH endonuclease n=1 Tax=Hymenobacter rubripertinctus TaxID=2029981 RepID=A0A418QUR5_9BACT|nr:HNH endonuclease [Hymenobacter rubripertinctus]RIY08873.1 HNH endonuclease [Hymenobacter rubripertinctus]